MTREGLVETMLRFTEPTISKLLASLQMTKSRVLLRLSQGMELGLQTLMVVFAKTVDLKLFVL